MENEAGVMLHTPSLVRLVLGQDIILPNNKNIDTISYNYMNLPQLVHIKGEGNVAYTYDAAGSRLLKVVTDSLAQRVTTITYVAGFVYQRTAPLSSPGSGTDTLQYAGHEEGRARWAYHIYTTGTTAYKFEYDFFEKDHLGNTRMVLTQERDTTNYLATMEYQFRATEEQLFGNITNTCAAWTSMYNESINIPNNVRYAYTSPNDSVSKVDSSSAGGQKTGPSLLLKVMSGDSVNIGVQCYYTIPNSGTNYSSFNDVLNSLANGLVNLTGGAHGTVSNLTSSSSSVYTGLTSFLGGDDTAHSGYPKAYINYIFLDDQFNYVSSLSGTVLAASANNPANQMNPVALGSKLALNRNGYLYIWVSNETSGWDVYFDNLSVQYQQGPVLEENHYYPFGLTMAGISDKAIKTDYSENKFRFNDGTELQNKEFADGTGLEMYDAGFRTLDPQLGRFTQIDPLSDRTSFLSAYQYADNNPISLNDPTGQRAAPPGLSAAQLAAWIAGIRGTFSGSSIDNGNNEGLSVGGSVGPGAYPSGDDDDDDDDDGSCSVATYSNYWSTLTNYLMGEPVGTTWNNSDELTGDAYDVSDQSLTSESDPAPTISLEKGSIGPFGVMDAAFNVSGVTASGLQAMQIAYFSPYLKDGSPAPGVPVPYSDPNEPCSIFYGFIDGGLGSAWASQQGHPIVSGEPYDISPESPGFISWDANTQSGGIHVWDNAYASSSLNTLLFQTYIIALNYNNSGQDMPLASFNWGYHNYGTNSISGSQINWSQGNSLSFLTQYLLKIYYPNYSTYGN
jgi:RHS repeat-associated protein